jgi:hypothetical protein
MDLLDAVLQRNEQSSLLATSRAGGAFTRTMTRNLFQFSRHDHLAQHAGLAIDPLTAYLGKTLAGTGAGQSLTAVNKDTGAGANEGRVQAEQQYQALLRAEVEQVPEAEQVPDPSSHVVYRYQPGLRLQRRVRVLTDDDVSSNDASDELPPGWHRYADLSPSMLDDLTDSDDLSDSEISDQLPT